MKKILRLLAIGFCEIFLVTIIPIAIYLDSVDANITLHPMFYCIVTYTNCKLLEHQYERYLVLMFLVDCILFITINPIIMLFQN